MDIRTLKPLETAKGRIKAGTILSVKPNLAAKWVASGDAEYVVKAIEPPENKAGTAGTAVRRKKAK